MEGDRTASSRSIGGGLGSRYMLPRVRPGFASFSLVINMWINNLNRLFHCIELAINQGTMTKEEAEAFGKCLRVLVNNFAV